MKNLSALVLTALLVACQTVTVQLGDYPSADRAAGVRSTPSVKRESETNTTTTTIHNESDKDKEQKK